MLVAILLVPETTGEVWEGNGSAVVVHRKSAQLSQRTPLCQIINIHIQWQAILQAVNQTRVHNEVHTTMTHLTAQFTILLQDRVIILLDQSFLLLLVHETMSIEVIHLRSTCTLERLARECKLLCRILGSVTLGTCELEQTVVWLRSHHVVLNLHHLTLGCTHQGSSMVTIAELLALLAALVLHPVLTHERLCVHGNERSKAVATVNIQALSNRAQAVSRINITTVLHVILHTPVEVILVIVSRILPVSIPEVLETVDISTLSTDDVTENAILSHSQRIHLIVVVAAVLQDEAMLASLLAQVNQAPALIQIHGTRNLDGCMLAILHRKLGNWEMVIPVGCDINQVDVRTLAQSLITLLAAIDVSRLQALLAQVLL